MAKYLEVLLVVFYVAIIFLTWQLTPPPRRD
jgi:hypothetical protein